MQEDTRGSLQRMSAKGRGVVGSKERAAAVAAALAVPQEETLVWQLEAAHLQTYYFSTTAATARGSATKSIGPFPQVTANLRKTDKFQLVRGCNHSNLSTIALLNPDTKQYVSCASDGTIQYVGDPYEQGTEWIMTKATEDQGAGGNIFKSRIHHLYLSYQDTTASCRDTVEEKKDTSMAEDASDKAVSHQSELAKEGGLQRLFKKAPAEPAAELFGSVTLGAREVWKLDPYI